MASKKITNRDIPVVNDNGHRIINTSVIKTHDIPEETFKSPSPVKEMKFKNNENNGFVQFKTGNKLKILVAILVIFLIVAVLALTATVIALYVTNDIKQNQLTTPKPTTTSTTSTTTTTTTTTTTSTTTTSNLTCGYGYTKTYCDECGKTFVSTNVRIIGGSAAYQNSWPSLALVVFKYKFFYTISGTTYEGNKQIICGGTLIDRKTVVTAAACYQQTVTYVQSGTTYTATVVANSFYPTIESMYRVYLGIYDNKYVLTESSSQAIEITGFIKHPSYDSVNQLNDIAILKLKTEATLGLTIQPACLPDPTKTSYPTDTNIDSWIAGWGNSPSSLNQILNNVKITIYPTTTCTSVSPSKSKDWARQLCAGDTSQTRDACTGDEGGPLFVKDSVNGYQKFVFVGIISYADSCLTWQEARIFTKVSYYLDWIAQYQ